MQNNKIDKNLITNFYEKVASKELPEIFLMTLPITLIQKSIFAHAESLLKEKFDLLHSEVDVLAALYTHDKELSPTQLYDLTIFSSGGMTKVLKRLEQRGLIYRKADTKDKRCMLVCLRDDGEKLIVKALFEISNECSNYFKVLDAEEKKQFSSLLKKVLLHIDTL